MLTTEQLRELADRLIEQVGYLDFNHHRNVMPPATLCAVSIHQGRVGLRGCRPREPLKTRHVRGLGRA